VLAIALTGSAGAAAPPQVNPHERDPAVWLRQVYDLYQWAEKASEPGDKASYRLIVERASKSFAALFKKNDDCETQSGGQICAIDWDFVIDGQDSTMSHVKVGAPVITGDKATVTVSFTNLNEACVNVYYFVREDDEWKVDDIKTKSGKDAPVWIAKLLKDFKY
jgi:hypothetical protein